MPMKPLKPCCAPGCRELVRGTRYCAKHQHMGAAWATSKRAERAGISGRPWRRLRDQILRRDNYLCQCEECRRTGAVREAHEVDHILPLSQGGSDAPSNLRSINRDCHRAKTQRESIAASRGI